MTNKTVSIIIRTFNEEKWIGTCIDKIKNQTFEGNIELFVVDSGSIDKTIEIARKKGAKIIKLDKKNFSYGRSLNKGIEKANGKYLVFISAHCIPKDDRWLDSLVSSYEKNIAAVYGPQFPHPEAPAYHRRRAKLFLGNKKIIEKDENTHYSNSNGSVRKDIWNKERFDEKLFFSEDKKWALNVLKKGFFIVYEPKASVYHYHNFNVMSWFRRNYNQGKNSGKNTSTGYYFFTRLFSMVRNTI